MAINLNIKITDETPLNFYTCGCISGYLGDNFGCQLPTNLLSVCCILSQLANDHLHLLAQSCGTVFQMTLHLL